MEVRRAGELRLEISKLKTVVEKKFGPRYSFSLFTLKFHPLEHSVDELERLRSLSSTNAALLERFNVLMISLTG